MYQDSVICAYCRKWTFPILKASGYWVLCHGPQRPVQACMVTCSKPEKELKTTVSWCTSEYQWYPKFLTHLMCSHAWFKSAWTKGGIVCSDSDIIYLLQINPCAQFKSITHIEGHFPMIVWGQLALPKRVGTWVGISNAKALGIVWRDRTSKKPHHYNFGCLCSQVHSNRTAAAFFSCPCSNPVTLNDSKRHCGIDSD